MQKQRLTGLKALESAPEPDEGMPAEFFFRTDAGRVYRTGKPYRRGRVWWDRDRFSRLSRPAGELRVRACVQNVPISREPLRHVPKGPDSSLIYQNSGSFLKNESSHARPVWCVPLLKILPPEKEKYIWRQSQSVRSNVIMQRPLSASLM